MPVRCHNLIYQDSYLRQRFALDMRKQRVLSHRLERPTPKTLEDCSTKSFDVDLADFFQVEMKIYCTHEQARKCYTPEIQITQISFGFSRKEGQAKFGKGSSKEDSCRLEA